MNRPIFVAVLAVAALALAQSGQLTSVCSKLIGTTRVDCFEAGKGHFLNDGALGACDHLIGDQVTNCVQAIADKDYGSGDVKTCNDLIGDKVVDCFRRIGGPHVEAAVDPAISSNAQVRAEIAAAIEQIRASDCRGAESRLKNLLRSMR
jgi:hypothetical protein